MKIYEPIAISLFTVLVLSATFMVGKHVGFAEGVASLNETMNVSFDALDSSGNE